MKRFPLMIASAVIGLALLAGSTHQLTAESSRAAVPPAGCYYFLYTCSYGGTSAYWSDCDPGYPGGMISSDFAAIICGSYHSK
jgi:hypothetical protein